MKLRNSSRCFQVWRLKCLSWCPSFLEGSSWCTGLEMFLKWNPRFCSCSLKSLPTPYGGSSNLNVQSRALVKRIREEICQCLGPLCASLCIVTCRRPCLFKIGPPIYSGGFRIAEPEDLAEEELGMSYSEHNHLAMPLWVCLLDLMWNTAEYFISSAVFWSWSFASPLCSVHLVSKLPVVKI